MRRQTWNDLRRVGREGECDDAHRDEVLAEIAAAGDEAERRAIDVPGPREGAALGRVVHAQLRGADPGRKGDAAPEHDGDQDAASSRLGRCANGREDADADHHPRREERGGERPELASETAASRALTHVRFPSTDTISSWTLASVTESATPRRTGSSRSD